MTKISTWSDLIGSLFDWNGKENEMITGPCLIEWLYVIQHDFDEVDALYLDFDICGGE